MVNILDRMLESIPFRRGPWSKLSLECVHAISVNMFNNGIDNNYLVQGVTL